MKKALLIILLASIYIGCAAESTEDEKSEVKVSLDSIEEEAQELGNFPEDAEVIEIENLKVNGEDIDGTDSVELDDTSNDTVEVEVTLPEGLSRTRSTISSLAIWINGEYVEVEFDLEKGTGTITVSLDLGVNYFTIYFEVNGNKYRSALIKITRTDASDTVSETPTPTPSPTPTPEPTPQVVETTINFNYHSSLVSAIGDLTLTISGSDMETATHVSSGTSSITISLLEGVDRNFTVIASTTSEDTTAALQFYGETVADISSQSSSINIEMKLRKTKVVVPDMLNERVVQFNDFSTATATWAESEYERAPEQFYQPSDILFDNAGRIYFYDSTWGIYRIDTIADNTPTQLADDMGGGDENFTAFEINRSEEIIYYATNGARLLAISANGETVSENEFTDYNAVFGSDNIQSITSEGGSTLYLVSGYNKLNKVTYTTAYQLSQEKQITLGSTESANDIVIWNGFLYVIIDDGELSVRKVAKYTLDLNLVEEYTNNALYGPDIFVGEDPDALIFIDDSSGSNQLFMIDGVLPVNTESYGGSGSGVGQFEFFEWTV